MIILKGWCKMKSNHTSNIYDDDDIPNIDLPKSKNQKKDKHNEKSLSESISIEKNNRSL